MKLLKKWSLVLALVLTVTLVTPVSSQLSHTAIAKAATVKISHKSLTLVVGKSETIKISGSNKKAAWTSSDKTVAVVSSTGKVTAKKAGSAVITATVDKKKYTCKVTVKKALIAVNPLVKNAPFKAQETAHGKFKFIIPNTWQQVLQEENDNNTLMLFLPVGADKEASSIIELNYVKTDAETDYEATKANLVEVLTADYIVEQLIQAGMTATVNDFNISDSDTSLGKAIKIEYTVDLGTDQFTITTYEIFTSKYDIEVVVTNYGEEIAPDLNVVTKYLLDTLAISK